MSRVPVVLVTMFATLAILVAGAALFIYSGFYDIAADQKHSRLFQRTVSVLVERSVERRAADINAPELTQAMVERGAPQFAEMCAPCHGAPGVEQAELAKGLNPKAPPLSKEADEFSSAELFWITRHGLKMTGMPAWGETHSDERLWEITAFVKALPQMSPEEYQRLTAAAERGPAGEAAGHTH